MKITLERKDDNFLFECKNENGSSVFLNKISEPDDKGVSPMEGLLMSLAGCSGIDMILILKKQKQEITDFRAEVEGDRVDIDGATPFRKIWVKFFLEGNIDAAKAKRTAKLSFEKYCSVLKSLHSEINLTYDIFINGEKVD